MPSPAYILRNRVTHTRTLPASSSHAFTYPTLSLLAGIDALESGKLNLASGWIFNYGSKWRLLGLRARPYLNTLSPSSIRVKLQDELRRYQLSDDGEFDDAWIMTMPSICGFEGINPLTVFLCYKMNNLWAIVLEIHNTFGESHIHVLEIDKNEDGIKLKGYVERGTRYDHQWTFRRQFHVSPFNDRSGYYTVGITSPSHSPSSYMTDPNTITQPPLPAVCVRLYTDPDPDLNSDPDSVTDAVPTNSITPLISGRTSIGKLKLAAYLRPTFAASFTTRNVVCELLRQPFALFLTFPRILYHAWILHYQKHLDVFPRPEPYCPNIGEEPPTVVGGGLGWQEESILEGYFHKLVNNFLEGRVQEIGISVSLIPSNPNVSPSIFLAGKEQDKETAHDQDLLEITYLSPRLFTLLFVSPSSERTLLVGADTEKLFSCSSRDLFIRVFSVTSPFRQKDPSFIHKTLQNFRRNRVPQQIHLPNPLIHFLDVKRSVPGLLISAIILWSVILLEWVERAIFWCFNARFVEGQEPWNSWKRAMIIYSGNGRKENGREKVSHVVHGSAVRHA